MIKMIVRKLMPGRASICGGTNSQETSAEGRHRPTGFDQKGCYDNRDGLCSLYRELYCWSRGWGK